MRATVLITYEADDIRHALLANAPDGTQVHIYRTVDNGAARLAVMVHVPGGASDPEAISWTPYTTSYPSGNDAVLLIDHAMLLDILITNAMDTLASSGLRVLHAEAATVSVHEQDLLVRIEFPLEQLRVPQRTHPLAALS